MDGAEDLAVAAIEAAIRLVQSKYDLRLWEYKHDGGERPSDDDDLDIAWDGVEALADILGPQTTSPEVGGVTGRSIVEAYLSYCRQIAFGVEVRATGDHLLDRLEAELALLRPYWWTWDNQTCHILRVLWESDRPLQGAEIQRLVNRFDTDNASNISKTLTVLGNIGWATKTSAGFAINREKTR